jgi:hypothetical protein
MTGRPAEGLSQAVQSPVVVRAGEVRVIGPDVYEFDDEGDGFGCDGQQRAAAGGRC